MVNKKTFKITLLSGLYVIYLMLSFIASGELAYLYFREVMGIAANITLATTFTVGTTIFIYSLRKLLREK